MGAIVEVAAVAEMWNPIFDVFQDEGIKFALEVHPSEIAFDMVTSQKAVEAVGGRKEFGFRRLDFLPSKQVLAS